MSQESCFYDLIYLIVYVYIYYIVIICSSFDDSSGDYTPELRMIRRLVRNELEIHWKEQAAA
jgi:hypothetical protein